MQHVIVLNAGGFSQADCVPYLQQLSGEEHQGLGGAAAGTCKMAVLRGACEHTHDKEVDTP